VSGSIPSSPPTPPPPAAAATPAASTPPTSQAAPAAPQTAPTPAVIQSFTQTQATVVQLPASLSQQLLAALNAAAAKTGQATLQLQGQVVGTDQSGNVLVKTDAGTLALKLPAAQTPPQGATVALQVGGSPAAPSALVVVQTQVAAAPPGVAAQAQPAQPTPNSPLPAPEPPAAQLAPAVQSKPVAQIVATVVSNPPTAPQNPPSAVPTGTTVQLRLVPDTPPQTAQPATPPPAQPASPSPRAAAPAPAQIAPAQIVPAQIIAAQIVAAKIVAHLPGGQTLLETPIGRLAAMWPPGLPRPAEGTTLSVELKLPPVPTKAAAEAATLRTGLPLAREWPTLKEALKTLGEAEPALARRLMDEALPRPGPRLALQIMSYLATDRADARSLLGENIAAALERAGKGEILQRLDGDLKEMQRQAAAPGDWRVAYVPFQDGGELRQMRIFARREEHKDKRARDAKRFVVEVEFSELGDVQIDGLMRKPKLELMLRTHKQIPADLRDEIELVFLDGCTLAGLAGKIYFQAGERFPVNPLEEIQRQSRGVIA